MAEQSYDAIVVGSGANGGWAAKELCEAGHERRGARARPRARPGDRLQRAHAAARAAAARPPGSAHRRVRAPPDRPANYACEETTVSFFADEVDHPFTFPKKRPFWWIRGNQVGGRTIMWGRQSYRMSDYDFKAKTPRRLRRRLADLLRRRRALLRQGRELHRGERQPRGRRGPARRQVPAADGDVLRRAHAQGQGRRHGPPRHHRARRGAHAAPQRARRLPLLRPLPPRLPHRLLLLEPDRRPCRPPRRPGSSR